MTIAACHFCPEGVILGTDSTSTMTTISNGKATQHFRDYEQKLFEVGPRGSTIGLATWGMGRIGKISHRTIAARLGYCHNKKAFGSMSDLAEQLRSDLETHLNTDSKGDWDKAVALVQKLGDDPETFTKEEMNFIFKVHDQYSGGGYFIGGRVKEAADCEAFEVKWSIEDGVTVERLVQEAPYFRGVPQIMQRLVLGYDEDLAGRVLNSGKWTGTQEELLTILESSNFCVKPELLPLRDAIDWIHTVIHTTIRAMKFSANHSCGGPVEIAAITTDRPFRWVCHKGLDAALITAQETRTSLNE